MANLRPMAEPWTGRGTGSRKFPPRPYPRLSRPRRDGEVIVLGGGDPVACCRVLASAQTLSQISSLWKVRPSAAVWSGK